MIRDDEFEMAREAVQVEALRFPRSFVYIALSILAWQVFWGLADRNQHNRNSQTMAWLFVFLAVWLAYSC